MDEIVTRNLSGSSKGEILETWTSSENETMIRDSETY